MKRTSLIRLGELAAMVGGVLFVEGSSLSTIPCSITSHW
jgi:hypothetical protein